MSGAANILCPVALAAFVLVVIQAFLRLGPARGVVFSLLGGWMFLPVFDGACEPPLLVKKEMFVPAVVLVLSIALEFRRWTRFRPKAIDFPAAVLVVGPFLTSVVNGLGAYDGAQASFQAFCTWVAPFLLGRLYLATPEAVSNLASSVVRAGLVYVPFCLWEIRMSPQLHRTLYGFHQHSFGQTWRFGGYRPMVFMAHGLMVGMFMAMAALVAYWMWRNRPRQAPFGIPMGWAVLALVVTTVLVKSLGAILLLTLGILVLEGTRRHRSSLLVLGLIAIPPCYCAARIAGWGGEPILALAARISPDRSDSLAYRLGNEDLLIAKAMQRPVLGWGRWGRSRVYDEVGNDVSVTDGLWIISLGVSGLAGLAALGVLFLLPVLLLLRTLPALHWGAGRISGVAALAVALALWAIDCLPNSMVNPMFLTIAGSLSSLALVVRGARRAVVGAPAVTARSG